MYSDSRYSEYASGSQNTKNLNVLEILCYVMLLILYLKSTHKNSSSKNY